MPSTSVMNVASITIRRPLEAMRSISPLTRARYRFVFLVLAPVMALFIYLRIVPTAQALVMSLYDWRLIGPPKQFVGLDNYSNLLQDDNFRLALTNTTVFAVATTITSVLLALLIAAVITQAVPVRVGRILELLYFIPVLVPMVPVALGWREIFNYRYGILNAGLGLLNIGPKPWLSDPKATLVAVVILSVWKQVGYNLIILVVGMRAIPRIYFEAAAADGASGWQQFRHITLPLLMPVILFVVVITTISSYNVFTQVYVLASDVQGAPGQLVRVLVYDIVENGFRFFHMGYASAEAVYLLMIILILTLFQFRFLRSDAQ